MDINEFAKWDVSHPLGYDHKRTVAFLRALADALEADKIGIIRIKYEMLGQASELPRFELEIEGTNYEQGRRS